MSGADDTVHVRLADDPAADGPDAPAQFLWCGRLYLVSAVLGYWREHQARWSPAGHGGGGEEAGGRVPPLPVGDRIPATGGDPVGPDREVWRVRAAPGRSVHAGVYHLAREAPPPMATARQVAAGSWRLLQVCD